MPIVLQAKTASSGKSELLGSVVDDFHSVRLLMEPRIHIYISFNRTNYASGSSGKGAGRCPDNTRGKWLLDKQSSLCSSRTSM